MKKYAYTIFVSLLLCSCIPIIPLQEEVPTEKGVPYEKVDTEIELVEKSVSSTATKPTIPMSCEDIGGMLHTEKKPPHSTFAVCTLPNGNECELQALLTGTCPSSGVRGNAFATPAARYCILSGGRYNKTIGAGEEQGTCNRNGKKCDVWELWNGTCS